MKVSINKLREELSKRKEELKEDLTPRLDSMLEIIDKELLEEKEIDFIDLLICIILRADTISAKYLIDLMRGLTPESFEYLDGWIISRSAAFIQGQFEKDKILDILRKNKDHTIED